MSGLPGRTAHAGDAGPESAPDSLWVTLGAIRPLDERQLAVFQPAAAPEAVALRAAQVLHRRFADWVVVNWANRDGTGGGGRPVETPATAGAPEVAPLGGTAHGTGGAAPPASTAAGTTWPATPVDARPPAPGPGGAAPLRRLVVCGPDDGSGLVATVVAQDPADCPLVAEAVRSGTSALQVRPDEVTAFGLDASGAPVLVAAEVTSLLCVPLRVADAGPVQGALTVFRTGARGRSGWRRRARSTARPDTWHSPWTAPPPAPRHGTGRPRPAHRTRRTERTELTDP